MAAPTDVQARLAELAKLPPAARPVVSVYLNTRWTDDKTRAEKDVQKLTDEHIKQIDGLIHAKEAEIMEV